MWRFLKPSHDTTSVENTQSTSVFSMSVDGDAQPTYSRGPPATGLDSLIGRPSDDLYENQKQTRRFQQEKRENMLQSMDQLIGHVTRELEGPLFTLSARDRTVTMEQLDERFAVVLAAVTDRHRHITWRADRGEFECSI
jgi:hypothetical protein